jgi:membrane-bound lytic murein transglycosylase A
MADRLVPASFADLRGFETDDHMEAFRHMVEVLDLQLTKSPALGPAPLSEDQIKAWAGIAKRATSIETTTQAKTFITQNFSVWRVHDAARPEGLFTGYFEPELKGSLKKSDTYPHPVYAKPQDLVALDEADQKIASTAYGKQVAGKPQAYDTRAEIDAGSLQGRAEVLCYVSSKTDLFFMQVQGSGRVALDNGKTLRLGYAAKTGRPYSSIGAVLVREGAMTKDTASMQSIKQWLKDNPAREDWLLWQNQSYVFFRVLDLPNEKRGAYGAAGVQLIPRRSIAIDKTRYAYGTPVWLSTTLPNGKTFQKLMISADTGSAILGAARGDVYFGWGAEAEDLAGHMKQVGDMFVLLPKP